MSERVAQADQVAAQFGAGALDAGAAVLAGEVPDGAELLRVLVDEVEGYDDARARALAVAGLLADPDQLDAVGLAYRRRRAGVVAELLRLEQVAGMKRHAAMLRTAIREAAGAAAGRPCEVEIDGARWWCPAGWSIDDGGLWRVVLRGGEPAPQLVAHAPIILRRRLRDLDGQAETFEVAWRLPASERWRSALTPRGEIADARAVLKLAALGAPVHSGSSGDLVRWFADFEAANADRIQTGWVSARMGWVGRGHEYFLAGTRLLSAPGAEARDIRLSESDPGASQVAAAIRARGTLDGWRAVWASVQPYPSATLAVYAACAAALLPLIEEAPCFAIDWNGPSGTGKTTTLRLAASVWGLPEDGAGLLRSWQGTVTGIERTAAALSGFPVCLDESNKVPLHERDRLAQLVYMLANGSGKVRGSLTGVQKTATWRSPILSTGESPLTSYTQDEGARARTVCLSGAPLGSDNAELAEEVRAGLLAHHGHLGPAWAAWLLGRIAELPAWGARYAERVSAWGARATTTIGRRAAQYIALLDLTAALLEESGLLLRPEADPIARAFAAAQVGGEQADRPAAALRLVWEWASSAPSAFWGRHRTDRDGEPIPPIGGWRGSWQQGETWGVLGAFPNQIGALLKGAGFEPEATVSAWQDRGWLQRAKSADGKGRTYPLPVDGARPRLLAFQRSAFRACGAEGGEDAA